MPLRVHEVEPLLCDDDDDGEEVELSALQGAHERQEHPDGSVQTDWGVLKQQEVEPWHQQEACEDFLLLARFSSQLIDFDRWSETKLQLDTIYFLLSSLLNGYTLLIFNIKGTIKPKM